MAVLYTHHFGDPGGRPVLAVHGITAHGRRFRRLAEEAWPDRHTIAVDLRGHGRSTPDGPWSIPQHVADLIDTLDHEGVTGPIDVVGHSYGGTIAVSLLAAAPERVGRLVLLDPALALKGDFAPTAALGTIEHGGWATVAEATAARNDGLPSDGYPGGIHPAVHEEVDEHLQLGDDGRYRFRYTKPAVVTGWGEVCTPLPTSVRAVPTLLLIADQAEMVTDDAVAGLQRLLGDHLEIVHLDCGHMVYWECFEDTAAVVMSFLAD